MKFGEMKQNQSVGFQQNGSSHDMWCVSRPGTHGKLQSHVCRCADRQAGDGQQGTSILWH